MTIAKLYENHKNGKVSKQSFLNEARKDANLPWVNNLTSYEDAVKILKNKGVISESSLKAHGATGPGDQKINMQGDAYSSNAEMNEDEYNDQWTNKKVSYKGKTATVFGAGDGKLDLQFDDAKQTTLSDVPETDVKVISDLNESHKLTTAQIIDRLNPYAFKHAMEFEISKVKEKLTDEIYEKTKDKVAKKMAKNPEAYRDTQLINTKDVQKRDKKLAMVDVKDNNTVDKDNEMKKVKGFEAKKNTSTPKSENKKGKPKGVKEMKGSNKKPSGVQTMMENTNRQDVVNELTNFFKKKISISENAVVPHERADYHIGTEIKTPEGQGKVTEVNGSVIHYELDGGIEGSKTLNVIDKLNGMNQSPEDMKKAQDENEKAERDEMRKETHTPVDHKNLMEKIKKVLDKLRLKEKKGMVVPKNATPQQVDMLAQKDPTLKPGESIEIVRK